MEKKEIKERKIITRPNGRMLCPHSCWREPSFHSKVFLLPLPSISRVKRSGRTDWASRSLYSPLTVRVHRELVPDHYRQKSCLPFVSSGENSGASLSWSSTACSVSAQVPVSPPSGGQQPPHGRACGLFGYI